MTRSRSKQVLADFSVPQDRVVQCLLVATFVDPFDGYTRMHMDTYGYVHIHTDTHVWHDLIIGAVKQKAPKKKRRA